MENKFIRFTVTVTILLNLLFYLQVQDKNLVLGQDVRESSCTEDNCLSEETLKEEKMKYYLEKAKEYHAARKSNGNSDEMTELKHILRGFRDKTIDIEDIGRDTEHDSNEEQDIVEQDINSKGEVESESGSDSKDSEVNNDLEQERSTFEFPKLSIIRSKETGDIVDIEIEEGLVHKMITRSILPPVFEIPDFLTDEECDHVIETARQNGLNVSNLFGSDIEEEFDDDLDLSEISRVSEQTWLREENLGSEFWDKLQKRLSKLTGLPLGLIQRGEPIQVVSYAPGGHYHAHLDTVDHAYHLPCCFQTRCGDKELTPEWAECCRLCRFATVLYYLNEPEEGGETAFPLADMPEELVTEKFVNLEEQEWYNLSHYCHNSSLSVKPKRGTAILWYNHFIDEQTGYLGQVDRRSNHGGCDLKKGSKWIANNWISGTTFDDRFKPSIFYTEE